MLIIHCGACSAEFKLDPAKVPAAGGFFKCKACGGKVQIPARGAAEATGGDVSASASVVSAPPMPAAPAPVPAPSLTDDETQLDAPAPSAFDADPIPLGDSMPPVSLGDGPHPDALGDSAPPIPLDARGAVIALGDSPPPIALGDSAPGAAIALGESALSAPPPLGDSASGRAIPLTASAADTAFPIGGSSPRPAPSQRVGAPSAPSAIALAGSDDWHETTTDTRVPSAMDTPAIPLAGADDFAQSVTAPHAIPDLGKRDSNGGSDDVAVPGFLHGVPKVEAEASMDDDLPSSELTDLGPTAATLDDLPAPAELDDLPTPDLTSTGPADLPTPVIDDPSLVLGDLPAPDTGAMVDLAPAVRPPAAAAAAADTIPLAGDDELPPLAPSPAPRPVEAAAPLAPPPGDDAPRLMDELAPPFADRQTMPIGLAATELVPGVDAATLEAPTPRARRRRGLLIGGLATSVLGLGALAALAFAPGLGLFGEAATSEATRKPAAKTARPAAAPAPATAPAKVETPPPPPPAPTPELTAANVDALTYGELAAASSKLAAGTDLDPATQGLLAWARFRMALHDDDEALKLLLAQKPADASARGVLGAAALAGATVLSGKVGPGQRMAERLLKTRFRGARQLALVAALRRERPADLVKAARHLELALAEAPAWRDARVARARVLLAKKASQTEGAQLLVEVCSEAADPALALSVLPELVAAGEHAAADHVALPLELESAARVPPSRRDALYATIVRKLVRRGDLAQAVSVARRRLEAAPDSIDAAIELYRLASFTKSDDAAAVMKSVKERVDAASQARLGYEEVRARLAAGDVEGARPGVATTEVGPGAPFARLGQAALARAEGKLGPARQAAQAALAQKPGLIEAQLLVASLAKDRAGLIPRLQALAKKAPHAAVLLELARATAATGNFGEAARLVEEASWLDPTQDDPSVVLTERIDWLDAAGHDERALALATAWRSASPKSQGPLGALLLLAERHGRTDEALALHRASSALAPDDVDKKLRLATALNAAGKTSEAEQELATIAADKRDARYLEALGRSWLGRDPIKARGLLLDALSKSERPSTLLALAELETAQNRTDEAIGHMKKALSLAPAGADAAATRLALARLLLRGGQQKSAAAELELVLRADPKHVAASELLGDTLLELDEPKKALAAYSGALGQRGDHPGLLLKVAKLQLESLGLTAPAVKTLRRLLKADPTATVAHYHLGLALKDLGKAAEARRELEAYVGKAPDGEFAADARRFIDDLAAF